MTEQLNQLEAGSLQLALFALVFGDLQVWWISSTLRTQDLACPLSQGEFRNVLERERVVMQQVASFCRTDQWVTGTGRSRFYAPIA